MNPRWLPDAMRWGASLALALALGVVVYALGASPESPPRRAFSRYAAALDRRCRLLYLRYNGAQIARWQLAAAVALVCAAVALEAYALAPLAVLLFVAPMAWLDSRVADRRRQLDVQLEGFLLTLSNALRSSPALGDALSTAADLVRAPIKDDIDFVLKEHRLGAPLDEALLNMSRRVESRSYGAALATILIGRQTGGDLPKILDRAASSLREMSRLEGVLQAKTAEGRAQAWVLGAIPFVVIAALGYLDPNWLAPLVRTPMGYAVSLLAAGFWVAAIVAARRILDVDL